MEHKIIRTAQIHKMRKILILQGRPRGMAYDSTGTKILNSEHETFLSAVFCDIDKLSLQMRCETILEA